MTNPGETPTSTKNMNRRDFIKASAIGAGVMILPSYVAGQSKTQKSPNERLNIGLIGCGGQGFHGFTAFREENVIALCDVDQASFLKTMEEGHRWFDVTEVRNGYELFMKKGAKWFTDYREMFVELGDKLDAVVVSVPDHMHYPIAMTALNLGKHLYCEKPLVHTVEEARNLAKAAARSGVVTQMGNQGQSNNGTITVREWLQAGVIGPIREVHSWTNRPIWPQGMDAPDHSKTIPVVPKDFRWDLWLGIAKDRAYDPAYCPFTWRGWQDFGTGAMGDMACHVMNAAFWGLDLTYPERISATSTAVNDVSWPNSSVITYQFPERGPGMPAVTYKWHDGGMLPPIPPQMDSFPDTQDGSGSILYGEEGILVLDTYGARFDIYPDALFVDIRQNRRPQRTERRIKGSHREEWLNAIREGRKASSDFSFAARFTETILLGNLSLQTQRALEYDIEKSQFTNCGEANALLSKEYPDGWILS